MKKLLALTILVSMLFSANSYAIVDWIQGDGSDILPGTTPYSDADYNITNYLQDPLDRLLYSEVNGCTLTRTSASVITISAGSITCANGANTIKRMRYNSATTTMTMTTVGVGGIDSGSAEVVSTWYDIYAVADANATTFTAIAAQQGTALSDVTYYAYIGSVYNDSGSDLKNFYWFGTGETAIVMWDVPISITTTVSAGVWSAAISCSVAMPSSSTCAIFGLYAFEGAGASNAVWIRPNGSTWNTSDANGVRAVNAVGGQRICMTDSSRQIQYYNHTSDIATDISVEGFYLTR